MPLEEPIKKPCPECKTGRVVSAAVCTTCYSRQLYQKNREKILAQRKAIREKRTNEQVKAQKAYAKKYRQGLIPGTAPADREAFKETNRARAKRPTNRFCNAKACAKRRGLAFTLTRSAYCTIAQMPCYYCDGEFTGGNYGIGLDRIDNDKGYELGNVLPCCGTCNTTRSDNWTVEETKAMIALVIGMRSK